MSSVLQGLFGIGIDIDSLRLVLAFGLNKPRTCACFLFVVDFFSLGFCLFLFLVSSVGPCTSKRVK